LALVNLGLEYRNSNKSPTHKKLLRNKKSGINKRYVIMKGVNDNDGSYVIFRRDDTLFKRSMGLLLRYKIIKGPKESVKPFWYFVLHRMIKNKSTSLVVQFDEESDLEELVFLDEL
jgi:hypothetical protein